MPATHAAEDNSHAGQGAVLLDIGGTVGALVVTMPRDLVGSEIEIRPMGHDHSRSPHDHHHPHVAVVARPRDGRHGDTVPSAVFGELEEGSYELYVRPDGPVMLVAAVAGGAVEFARWPGA
jgi:hypothetical protein